MGKLEEGQEILKSLGLPIAQQTAIASYTLLALANVKERDRWNKAEKRTLKIHDILTFIKSAYNKVYAENTRETVRRQVLHQLIQARVVDINPLEPNLATNSPRTHYALSEDALDVIRAHGTIEFSTKAQVFEKNHGALLKIYQAERNLRRIPVTLPSGKDLTLSPGDHNLLQAAIIKEFAPRFIPGSTVLYLGDTANKALHVEETEFERIGVPLTKHDKLPDVVLLYEKKEWLVLIEAVTSHGPVSPKRMEELESFLSRCRYSRIYVSAFLDLVEFKRHIHNIAWETEVWIAETPDHMVHFNGDKFLGPAKPDR